MTNLTILQFFHWYYPFDGSLWKHLAEQANQLKEWNFSHVWLPPAYKSAGDGKEPGYAVYDLFDLGEFDQKGSVRTKYGTKDEYLQGIETLHNAGVKLLADIVLNHRMGGDEKETVRLQPVDEEKRNERTGKPIEVELNIKFTFPGRAGKYSDFIWDQQCFKGIKHEDKPCLIVNEYSKEGWDEMVSDEKQNYDYLMGNDVEFRNPAVREELQKWGKWYIDIIAFDGVRLDGLKHINHEFCKEWLSAIKEHSSKELLVIGEFWNNDKDILVRYLDATEGMIQLFDVPLHFNFHEASEKGEAYDLRQLATNTLMEARPDKAITFVDNHDTQPFQSLQSWVKDWFKPLAYAFILLREQGIPCVFYPAMYGAEYADETTDEKKHMKTEAVGLLPLLLKVRNKAAYGWQHTHFEKPDIIGWGREGNDECKDSGCAVLISNKNDGALSICMGLRNAGRIFKDVTGSESKTVIIDANGCGYFSVKARSVSVWINITLNL